MAAKFAVNIKSKAENFNQTYNIPAPDSTMAYTWGEKQAESLGLKSAKIEVAKNAEQLNQE